MIKFDHTAPFYDLLKSGATTYVGGTDETGEIVGGDVNRAMLLLTTHISMMRLLCKGIKPNRNYRLKDVKEFFGLKGSKEKVLMGLRMLQEDISAQLENREPRF